MNIFKKFLRIHLLSLFNFYDSKDIITKKQKEKNYSCIAIGTVSIIIYFLPVFIAI